MSEANPGRRVLRVIVRMAAISVVSGCSTLCPGESAAGEVAVQFHQAISAGDGSIACSVLAPDTVHELEQTAAAPCAEAVLKQDLPDARTAQVSQAFGRGAQVLMDGDVVFLAMFDGKWKITAAGCQSRGDRPYDCELKGS